MSVIGPAIFRRDPLTGALNAGLVGKTRDSRPVFGFIACCQHCDCQALSTRCRRTLASCDIAGTKRRSLLTAGDNDELFMT